jgi:hypothetical protein
VPEPWALELGATGALAVDHLDTRVDPMGAEATIRWRTRDFAVVNAVLERRLDQGDWTSVGLIQAYEGGLFTHVERNLSPLARYAFRLRCQDGSGWTYTGETTFFAPDRPALGISVFPNPVIGEVHFRYFLPRPTLSSDRIEVFDLSGRRVFERRLSNGGEPTGVLQVDSRSLSPGIYFLRLSSGSNSLASGRFVILR